MQYENGCWLFKEGVQAFWPKQALQLYVKSNSIIPTAIDAPDVNVSFEKNVEFKDFEPHVRDPLRKKPSKFTNERKKI